MRQHAKEFLAELLGDQNIAAADYLLSHAAADGHEKAEAVLKAAAVAESSVRGPRWRVEPMAPVCCCRQLAGGTGIMLEWPLSLSLTRRRRLQCHPLEGALQ